MHYLSKLIVFPFLLALTSCSLCNDCGVQARRLENATDDVAILFAETDLPEVMHLEDIIEVALNYNLDLRVKQLEWEVQNQIFISQKLKMLPAAVFSNEFSERNNSPAVIQVTPTNPEGTATVSQQKQVRRWDMTATFNLLDFGLAYFRSHSEKNRRLTYFFQYERLKQNLILDITKAYWKGIGAKRAINKARLLRDHALDLLEKMRRQREARLISEISGLESEERLLYLRLRIHNLERTYESAKVELAGLMGLPPAVAQFDLADEEISCPFFDIKDIEELENLALLNRPELYASDADEQLSAAEVRVALIQIFPRAEAFLGYNENVDKFLVHHHWALVGARTIFNLLAVPWHITDTRAALRKQEMSRESRLALSIAVITQVNLARFKYEETLSAFKIRQELFRNRDRMQIAARKEYEQGEFHAAALIDYESDAMQSEIDLIQAYVELQIALEQLGNAIGVPLFKYWGFCEEG